MRTLREDLEVLSRLSELRDRATELRKKGVVGLDAIECIPVQLKKRDDKVIREIKVVPRRTKPSEEQPGSLAKWRGMGNKVEAALLVKVQRDRHLGPTNDGVRDSDPKLADRIASIDLNDVLPPSEDPKEPKDLDEELDRSIHILFAAIAMQVLANRPPTALSKETMYCYYAILQELNLALRPDYMIGGARAGEGGSVSSFVTGECIRAILALERVLRNSAAFMARTRELNEKFLILRGVIDSVGGVLAPEHPLQRWIDKVIERMWLDWYISVENQGEICFPMPPVLYRNPTFELVGQFFRDLPGHLKSGSDKIRAELNEASTRIGGTGRSRPHEPGYPDDSPPGRARRHAREYAALIIHDATSHAGEFAARLDAYTNAIGDDHRDLLKDLEKLLNRIAARVHRVLDPSKRYVQAALDRALADSETQMDAGELAFAACSYGAVTDWQSSSIPYLRRACKLLLQSVPESGTLSTRRPFHSTPRGYKLFPTSCEMVRSLAVLIDNTGYEIDESDLPALRRIIDSIDDKKIDLDKQRWYSWNFDGANNAHEPSILVSCVTVFSLDRLVRMLDSQINAMVFRHFEVTKPSKPHSEIDLNDLIYPDYGFALDCPLFEQSGRERTPIAITLEEMRAHLLRVSLPPLRTRSAEPRSTPFSAVLYGPPQTGKTTLADALALSSNVPVVRLSAFDLSHDPSESIESRGRVIFDTLAMLTNVVIIFDEFESVLQEREQRHELSLEFLLTGLLPKLVKLHTLAKSQGLVYFLATNRIDRIDAAAIRRGRFDLQLPVYYPDTLSRTAACLYRLQMFNSRSKVTTRHLDAAAVIRLLTVVNATMKVPPNELAKTFFRIPQVSTRDPLADSPYFGYILEATGTPPFAKSVPDQAEAVDAPRWVREAAWLKRFERSFQQALHNAMQQLAAGSESAASLSAVEILESCLRPPPPTTS